MADQPDRVGRLDEIAAGYDPSNPGEQFDYWLKRLQAAALEPWLRGQRVLELGCSTGELATLLSPTASAYVIVEGSAMNIDLARRRLPEVEFVHSLWEEFEPEPKARFSDIVLFNALEHIDDPVGLLQRCASWLTDRGRIHVVVPNGLSFHRLVGVAMGLQPDPLSLTEGDRAQGHVRNYTLDSLGSDVAQSGLRLVHRRGIFLKVLANRQMLDWDWELISALDEAGQRVPEHCAELFVVLER